MAAYEHTTWHRVCVHACVCVCVCTHVLMCAYVRVCVISEIKHSFQSLRYLHNYIVYIYSSNHLIFHHVGLSFCFYMRK